MRGIRSNHRAISRPITLLVAMMLLLSVPAVASAQETGPTGDQYNQGLLDTAAGGGPTDPAVSVSDSSSLPFTGLDVAAVAAIGIALLGSGLLIRHVARAGSREA